MLISYKWLQDYVQIPWEPEELARRLTMAGLEVEGTSPLAPELPRVYTGFVNEVAKHPGADSLNLCSVDVGGQGVYSIVCGAPNVAEGQTVAVALEGARLPGGLEIKPTEIRGIRSSGMICSQSELGLSDDHDGIWVLPDGLGRGLPLAEAVGLDDVVLDVSVYANRPDCMSVLGVAREVAALTGGEITLPPRDYHELETPVTDKASVVVEDKERCPRYTAALLDGVKVAQSPLWMQLRLKAAGMRPINNVVDITNYVMLETGQPLHAFDFEQLNEGLLVVRTARPGETMETLDAIEREFSQEMLLICDAQTPRCIAGVMGGLDGEVTAQTTQILLETANFAHLNVRRTSRALGLSSESSARFEKGIDPSGTIFASRRALHLLQKLAQARVFRGHIDIDSTDHEPTVIELCLAEIERLLGIAVPAQTCKAILHSLDFQVKELTKDHWSVTVPSHRTDVKISADLIEEIVRIWGLENLPSTLPGDMASSGGQSRRLDVASKLREILVGVGLQEALSYTFGRMDNNDRLLRFEQPMITVQNPISEDLVAMRHSLLPGLLTAIGLNASRQQGRVALFEIGANYLGSGSLEEQPREEMQLCLALWGHRHPENWGLTEEDYDFYDIKAILELILPGQELSWAAGANPSFHPGRQGSIKYQGHEVVVYGEVHPAVLRNFKVPGRVYAAELRLEPILKLFTATPSFSSLPKYPAVDRDLAFVIDREQAVGELIAELKEIGGELLQEVTLFDLYEGKPIPTDKKSVAFALRFQAERTLKDDEINPIMERCVTGMRTKFRAEIR
ncbi:MAG: phenylalanine--tRNA ligase subunit beta [Limnochordia bacterium]|jgi:phenylalanyl-tRNA synthetase beta chain|nr:phenylalanine--tRNA ligase subunit beta [Limnochordia bacterium]